MLPSDVVAKLNECAHTDFVSKRDWWFGCVSVATALVAFGLVFEAPELIHDLIPVWRKIVARLKKLPIDVPKREAPDWVKVVAFIGWILIVVGVVGEEFAGIKVNNLDANIQECSDAKVQAATLGAGDAAQSARTAREEADAATGASGKALNKSKEATDTAGDAQEKVGVVARLADETNRKVEATKLATSRIQDGLTPRSAGTNGEQNSELQLFEGTKAAIIFSTDADSRDLTQNIIGILQRAHWNVLSASPDSTLLANPSLNNPAGEFFSRGGQNFTVTQLPAGAIPEGVSVLSKPDGKSKPSDDAARLLCYVLRDNQVGCDTWAMNVYQGRHWSKDIPDDAVQVLVGRKTMAYLRYLDRPEVQEALLESEKRSKTMLDSDRRDRQNILEKRRKELNPRN